MPWPRFLLLALLAFLILGGYEAARAPVESLFLARHGREALPLAWLTVAVGITAVVAAYNLLASRIALLPLLALSTSGAALVLGLLVALPELPGRAWLLYVWKDLYIVVLLEGFWSLANTTTPLKTARFAYGGLLAAGTLGALFGGAWVARLAEATGQATLVLVLPCLGATLAVVAISRWVLPPQAVDLHRVAEQPALELRGSLARLRQSRILGPLALLILATQVVGALVDYTYQGVLVAAFPEEGARTAAIAEVYQAVNATSLTLQLTSGLVLALGLRRVFAALPILVGLSVGALLLHPVFAVAALARVVGKSIDYSLLRACKEMLYIPLSYAEKTQGKALVDMLVYRVAKGGAALLLLGLVAVGAGGWSGWLALGGVGLWIGLALVISRRMGEPSAG